MHSLRLVAGSAGLLAPIWGPVRRKSARSLRLRGASGQETLVPRLGFQGEDLRWPIGGFWKWFEGE